MEGRAFIFKIHFALDIDGINECGHGVLHELCRARSDIAIRAGVM
jgi:hypothetical protein